MTSSDAMRSSSGPSGLLPEHAGNPFIEPLGPYKSYLDFMADLGHRPQCSPADRLLPHHVRRQCVLRLLDYMFPMIRQVQLAEQIMMVIRHGYEGRDPRRDLHRAAILDAADRSRAKDLKLASSRGVVSSADGLAFLGHPGVGKTKTIEKILATIPTLVRPAVPEVMLQVPWLKVEAPSRGTRRQFCIAFFQALGARVGQDYYKMYVKARQGHDELMAHVQQLAHIHALGVLVVDEIQHLARSPEGVDTLMSFLVTLVNTIGVPVVLIGTMGASPIVAKDFREARRSNGLGGPTWERLAAGDGDWQDFVEDMWRYQWTDVETPLSAELADALYDECQGIPDVAVRLFLVCQMRAIGRGELKDGADETMTPALLRDVASQDFALVRPFMKALREGEAHVLAQYPDLTPLHQALDKSFVGLTGMTAADFREARRLSASAQAMAAAAPDDPLTPVRAVLAARGILGDDADGVLAEALRRSPSADLFALVASAAEILRDLPANSEVKAPVGPRSKAPRAASVGRGGPPAAAEDPQDLRAVAATARTSGASIHSALSKAGRIASAKDVVAA